MPSDNVKSPVEEAKHAADQGVGAFKDAMASAERRITEAAKVAEKALKEGAETLRAQAKAYAETAQPQLEEAQRYVTEKVRERPVTTTLASLGVGLLIGLLLSSRNK